MFELILGKSQWDPDPAENGPDLQPCHQEAELEGAKALEVSQESLGRQEETTALCTRLETIHGDTRQHFCLLSNRLLIRLVVLQFLKNS